MISLYLPLVLFSLSLRWLIFCYVKMRRLWELVRDKYPPVDELIHCPYCQTIEASWLAWLLLGCPTGLTEQFLTAIASGYLCLILDPLVEGQIAKIEARQEIQLELEQVEQGRLQAYLSLEK